MTNLLPLLILLPVAGAILLVLLGASAGKVARWSALLASLATLGLSLVVAAEYHGLGPLPKDDVRAIHPRLEARYEWLQWEGPAQDDGVARPVKLEFYLGVDGVSVSLLVLTALSTVSAVLASWQAVTERQTEFYACLLVLETGLLGAFCAFDLVLFYVFFEFTLIPLFFLVGVWGGAERRYAAAKFFIYTLSGSMITLIGLVSLILHVAQNGLTTPASLPALADYLRLNPLGEDRQWLMFLSLSAGFVIKVPLFPFHTWLPLAHTEAPTAGSVMLAGVLLKLGTYGFLRICLPLFPEAIATKGVPLVATLSAIGIIYGALCSLAQEDIKKLVAYSSVSHLGFCMLGMFALNAEGISGSVLQMINHGLSTGGLFLLVGMLYERYHTRQLRDYSGMAARLPLLSICMIFVCFSSMGLPGLNGFVGEVLCLSGMFKAHPIYAVFGATGVVLGAWYLLSMLQQAFFGPLREPRVPGHHGHGHAPAEPPSDLNVREGLALAPILALCLWLGVYPQPLVDLIKPDVESIAKIYADKDKPKAIETVGAQADGAMADGAMADGR